MERKGWKVIEVTDKNRALFMQLAQRDKDFHTYLDARRRILEEARVKSQPLFEAAREELNAKNALVEEIRALETDGAWVIDEDVLKEMLDDQG